MRSFFYLCAKEVRMEQIKTIARYKSFCYVCEENVYIGQTIFMTHYIHPKTNTTEIAWRHPECCIDEDIITTSVDIYPGYL